MVWVATADPVRIIGNSFEAMGVSRTGNPSPWEVDGA